MDTGLLLGLLLSLIAEGGVPPPAVATCFAWLGGVLAAVVAWGILSRYVVAAAALRGATAEKLIRRHGRMGRVHGLLWVAGYATVLFFGRWPDLAQAWVPTELLLLDRLLVLLPMLVIVLVYWTGSFLSAGVLRRALSDRGFSAAKPVRGPGSYLAFRFRQYLLILLVPYCFVLGGRDLVFLLLGGGDAAAWSDATIVAWVVLVYVFSPLMLRAVWPTQPLPDGPLRQRLPRVAERVGVRVSEVYLWHTGGFLVNACMTGFFRPLRYVFLSDTLVEQLHPSQVEAVFAHELGHARFHHIPFYFVVAVGGMVTLLVLAPVFEWLGVPETLGLILAFTAYWGGFFGMVSRRFERQSDLAGAAAVLCPGEVEPGACPVHRPDQSHDEEVTICSYRAWAMTSALQRIAALNGVSITSRSWRHGSIVRRINAVNRMVGRAEALRRYTRRLRLFKGVFFVAVVAGAVLLVGFYGVLYR